MSRTTGSAGVSSAERFASQMPEPSTTQTLRAAGIDRRHRDPLDDLDAEACAGTARSSLASAIHGSV